MVQNLIITKKVDSLSLSTFRDIIRYIVMAVNKLASNVHQFLPFSVQAAVTAFVLGMFVTAEPLSVIDNRYTNYGQELDHTVFGISALGLTLAVVSFCLITFPIMVSYAIMERVGYNFDQDKLNNDYRWLVFSGVFLNIISMFCLIAAVGIRMYIICGYLLIPVVVSSVILVLAIIIIVIKMTITCREYISDYQEMI